MTYNFPVYHWLKAHRTRLLGYAAMLLSTIQISFDQIRDLIPEKHRPLVLFLFGLVVASVGWLNAQRAQENASDTETNSN